MHLIGLLEAGRRDFLDASGDVLPGRESARPSASCWSVLECIEHVIAFENQYLGWISTGIAVEPRRNAEKELRLFTTIRSRLTKVEAREIFRPCGRFKTLPAAVAEFRTVRDRSVHVVQEHGDAIYTVGVQHPHFGPVNGAELVQLIDGHARRHAEQIRETWEALASRPVK